MKHLALFLMLFLCTAAGWAQGLVKGKVLDKRNSEPLSFVNVKVSQTATGKFVSGGMTDAVGNFNIQGLANDRYTLELTFVGYKTETRKFEITASNTNQHYNIIYMSEDAKMLKGVTVTGQRSAMKLEVDRKTFDVAQLIGNAGQAGVRSARQHTFR